MLDIKRIRENPEAVKAALERRGKGQSIDEILNLDSKRRAIVAEVEALKSKRNSESKSIPALKKKGEDVTAIFEDMKRLGEDIKKMDAELDAIEKELRLLLMSTPNTPNPEIPDGLDDTQNVEVRKFMEPTTFDFEPKAHW